MHMNKVCSNCGAKINVDLDYEVYYHEDCGADLLVHDLEDYPEPVVGFYPPLPKKYRAVFNGKTYDVCRMRYPGETGPLLQCDKPGDININSGKDARYIASLKNSQVKR